MNKTKTRWLVFASSLITLAIGCYSMANRTPTAIARTEDALGFALYSPILLFPFWISLRYATNKQIANRVLVIGSFLISIVGSWFYYEMLVTYGKAEAIFSLLIVPALQFFLFVFLWLTIIAINENSVS